MIESITKFVVNTPFYPHWLDFKNQTKADDECFMLFRGNVLETGCGNCEKKDRALKINKKIKKYVASDYVSWDKPFIQQKKLINSFGTIGEIIFCPPRDKNKIDIICNAYNLPFNDEEFDTYCCFEVLEHIDSPLKLFVEANRVLKKNGILVVSTPFLYREHGSFKWDFQRLAKGGFVNLAQATGFSVKKIITYSNFGTTLACLVNHYIIRKIMEGNILMKIFLLSISPVIFCGINTAGYLLDKIDHDDRFALRYHVVMRKNRALKS